MAYYVVLSFFDEEEAEYFIHTTQKITYLPYGVVGVFKRPTIFCDMNKDEHPKSGKLGYAYTKGKKWGWWVCAQCKKPQKLWGQRLQAVLADSRNLLQEILDGRQSELDRDVQGPGSHPAEGVRVPQEVQGVNS